MFASARGVLLTRWWPDWSRQILPEHRAGHRRWRGLTQSMSNARLPRELQPRTSRWLLPAGQRAPKRRRHRLPASGDPVYAFYSRDLRGAPDSQGRHEDRQDVADSRDIVTERNATPAQTQHPAPKRAEVRLACCSVLFLFQNPASVAVEAAIATVDHSDIRGLRLGRGGQTMTACARLVNKKARWYVTSGLSCDAT